MSLEDALLLPKFNDNQVITLFGESINTSQLYKETNITLTQAAKVYLADEKALVRAYNKTKHGFVVTSNRNFIQTNTDGQNNSAWIIGKNPKYKPNIPSGDSVIEIFVVKIADVNKTMDRMPMLTGALRIISGLTSFLLEKNLITSADSKA